MKNYKWLLSATLSAIVFATILFGCQKNDALTSDAKGGAQSGNVYGLPTITSTASTLESIDITFTAGENGAPAGFSLQWTTKAQLDAMGGIWPADTNALCKASFSGKASMSNYALAAGETVIVRVGDLLLDNGASTNCASDLVCGTEYVFRAFSHGDNKKSKSAMTPILSASTTPCPVADVVCHHGGQGYWANHIPLNEWPTQVEGGLMLGSNFYTNEQLQSILTSPAQGNGYVTVAHQLIPALLNQLSGATYSPEGLATAQAYIGSNLVPPVGTATIATRGAAGIVAGINELNHKCN
jgi:hypothetical protein